MFKGSTHITLVNTNGLYHQPNYQNKNKGCPQCYLHRLYGRATTSLFMVNGLNNVPIAEKVCNEGDGIRRPTISAGKSVSWSARIKGDTGIETGMVCEEGHDDILIQKKEGGVGILNNVQELSPWGDVQNQDGIGIESIEDDFHVDGNGIESIEDDFHVDSEDLRSTLEPKLHFLEERDEEILSSRILELSRSNKVRSALELYISMEASCLQPSTRACNSLLSCLLRNGFLNDALRVFETMKKETTSGHTYSLILKAVAKARGCDTALKMFMKLERKGTVVNIFDVITYNTMISICVKVNNWVQAERIWKSLKENGHRATTITYDLLVSTFVRCGQSELAFDAYSEMVQNGLKPSGDMMQALISACVKEGKWGLARSVFQSMLESGLNPNIVTYNALINSIGKAGEVELCFKVFGLMKNSGHTPDAYTWNALLGALNRGNRHMDTLRLFESIKRKKSIQLNAHLYNTALLSCQRLGSWDRSLQILWQMEASDIPISTESYNLVLGSCEAARKPKVALQVYEQMVHKKCIPDTFTYLSLIRSCSWGSLWSEVKEILDHVPPDVSLYNAVIHGMCLRGNISLAKKMYMKMCEIGLKPDGKTRALMIQNLRKNSITKNNRYPSQRHHHYA